MLWKIWGAPKVRWGVHALIKQPVFTKEFSVAGGPSMQRSKCRSAYGDPTQIHLIQLIYESKHRTIRGFKNQVPIIMTEKEPFSPPRPAHTTYNRYSTCFQVAKCVTMWRSLQVLCSVPFSARQRLFLLSLFTMLIVLERHHSHLRFRENSRAGILWKWSLCNLPKLFQK